MAALLVGLGATVLGVLLHAAFMRRMSVNLVFFSVPGFLLVALAIAGLAYGWALSAPGVWDMFLAFALTMSLGLCYALVLFGVVHDSPTLALANAIDDYGPAGMPKAAMSDVTARYPFVSSRLEALVTGGQVWFDGTDVVARPGASFLIRLGTAYRALRGGDDPAG